VPAAKPAAAWLSMRHSNAIPDDGVSLSLPVKLKLAEVEVLGFGGVPVIVVSGGVLSGGGEIVQVWDAAFPRLPARSVARTWKACSPSARPVYRCGLVQAAHSPASSLHSKSASSPALNSKPGPRSVLGLDGEPVIVATGASVSIVQVWDAAAPWLPARSVARTWNVCSPPVSGVCPAPP
jgi:hypothetical protein